MLGWYVLAWNCMLVAGVKHERFLEWYVLWEGFFWRKIVLALSSFWLWKSKVTNSWVC